MPLAENPDEEKGPVEGSESANESGSESGSELPEPDEDCCVLCAQKFGEMDEAGQHGSVVCSHASKRSPQSFPPLCVVTSDA